MKKAIYILIALVAISCSTTKVLHEGESTLAENKIVVTNSNSFSTASLQPYIKQKPNTYFVGKWNPFLYVYNWSTGSGSGWDRFVKKLGTAPVIFEEPLVESSKNGMLSRLQYIGYYYSTIDPEVKIKDKIAKVRYNVTLGKQFPINDINYIIPDSTMASLVAKDSAHFTIHRGGFLSEDALEKESERMAQLFRNNGYWGFTKNYFFYYADTTSVKDKANLTVRLENYTRNETVESAKPHKQYYIGDVTVVPQRGLKVRKSFIDNLNRIKSGSLYNEQEINTTYERFSSIRLFSAVNLQLNQRDSSLVDCRILLSPAKLQSVRFNFEGSFNSSGLFGVSPSLSYTHRNIFGGGEMLSLGLRGNFQFMFVGDVRANEFAITSSIAFPQFLFLPESLFGAKVPRTDINIAFSYQDRPEYKRNILSTSYGYNWSMNNKFFYQIYPLRINAVKVTDFFDDDFERLLDPFIYNSYRSHFDIGAAGMFYYTTDPAVNPANSHFYLRWNTDIAGNVLSLFNKYMKIDSEKDRNEHLIWGVPYSQFVRSELTLSGTLKFGKEKKLALASRLVAGAGYAYGNSSSLPFEQLFFGGGANSLRGWQSRSVGPGSAPIDTLFSITNQTGDMRLEGNLEFRFPLFWKVNGGFFVDAGNVWNINKSDIYEESRDTKGNFSFKDFYKTLAINWGFGLRLDFDLILVRLDMGVKAYNPTTMRWHTPKEWFKKDGYAIHFGIGYPF